MPLLANDDRSPTLSPVGGSAESDGRRALVPEQLPEPVPREEPEYPDYEQTVPARSLRQPVPERWPENLTPERLTPKPLPKGQSALGKLLRKQQTTAREIAADLEQSSGEPETRIARQIRKLLGEADDATIARFEEIYMPAAAAFSDVPLAQLRRERWLEVLDEPGHRNALGPVHQLWQKRHVERAWRKGLIPLPFFKWAQQVCSGLAVKVDADRVGHFPIIQQLCTHESLPRVSYLSEDQIAETRIAFVNGEMVFNSSDRTNEIVSADWRPWLLVLLPDGAIHAVPHYPCSVEATSITHGRPVVAVARAQILDGRLRTLTLDESYYEMPPGAEERLIKALLRLKTPPRPARPLRRVTRFKPLTDATAAHYLNAGLAPQRVLALNGPPASTGPIEVVRTDTSKKPVSGSASARLDGLEDVKLPPIRCVRCGKSAAPPPVTAPAALARQQDAQTLASPRQVARSAPIAITWWRRRQQSACAAGVCSPVLL